MSSKFYCKSRCWINYYTNIKWESYVKIDFGLEINPDIEHDDLISVTSTISWPLAVKSRSCWWFIQPSFQWSLDKLVLTDADGGRKSFCKQLGQLLPSGLPVKLKLKEGDCVGGTRVGPGGVLAEYPIAPYVKVRQALLEICVQMNMDKWHDHDWHGHVYRIWVIRL